MQNEKKDKLICSDVEGALCFRERAPYPIAISLQKDGLIEVLNDENSRHLAYDVTVDETKVYFGCKTRELCLELHNRYAFVLATGGRLSTAYARRSLFSFADRIIAENGGIIVDASYNEDKVWSDYLKAQIKILQTVQECLTAQGWRLSQDIRTTSIRVRHKDNPHKTAEEFKELTDNLGLPPELKKTMNVGHLDILPERSGKGNALCYILADMGYKPDQAIAIGDDINDICLLSIAGAAYIVRGLSPAVIETAELNKWYVSSARYMQGIIEILEHVKMKTEL